MPSGRIAHVAWGGELEEDALYEWCSRPLSRGRRRSHVEDHFKQAAQNAAQKSSEMSGNDRKKETQSKTDPVVSSGICRDLPEDSASFMSSNENVNGSYRTRTIAKFPEEYADFKTSDA